MRKRFAIALLAGFAGLSTVSTVLAEETRYYNHTENRWESGDTRRARTTRAMARPDKRFLRQAVRIDTDETPGTIIIDTDKKFLYYVEGGGRATRYGVGVGKEGFSWGGVMKVGRKAEWPGWTPPKEMIVRERAKGHELPNFMEGGPDNPLGARALYLYRGNADSMFRIHGTNQPWTIGQNMSSGCIRMMNEDVTDLYERADRGTKVLVIGPGGGGRDRIYAETGVFKQAGGFLSDLFGG